MRVLMQRSDVPNIIQPRCESYAQELVDKLGNELDFVTDLSIRVPANFAATYLGTPGPDEQSLIDWTTYMFWYLFFPAYPDEVTQTATDYSAKTRDYLDTLIQTRKASGEKIDDVVGRAIELQKTGTPGMTDVDIRNNLIGMMIGAVSTTSKASALVMDYLLDNPTVLSQAQQFARQGDDEKLTNLVLEVLRFKAFNPGVFRITLEDYRLGGGRWYGKTIKKGEKVMVLTQSAMMDKRAVSKPQTLALDRPRSVYMPFGYGTHTCSGYYINLVQIPAILKPILKKSSVRRADGEAGKMRMNQDDTGPFPASLKIIVAD
jgi:cytochrome P450